MLQKWMGSIGGVMALLVSGAAFADTPKLHPLEKLCVTYELSGEMMEGQHEQCHRQWAYESYRLERTKIKVPGFNHTQSRTVVTIGPDIYSIDREAGTGTKMQNPVYDEMVKASRDNPEGLVSTYAEAMNMQATGETEEILGRYCKVYANPEMGEACMTDDGILLRMRMPQMAMTAVKVAENAGDSAIYDLPGKVRVTAGPALPQNMQEMMKQHQQR